MGEGRSGWRATRDGDKVGDKEAVVDGDEGDDSGEVTDAMANSETRWATPGATREESRKKESEWGCKAGSLRLLGTSSNEEPY